MTSADYEKLMWRGWRRCGTYYYKWDMEQSCCQPYTIRCSIDDYKITKSQKQVLKKFNKFLKGQFDGTKKDKEMEEEKKGEEKKDVKNN